MLAVILLMSSRLYSPTAPRPSSAAAAPPSRRALGGPLRLRGGNKKQRAEESLQKIVRTRRGFYADRVYQEVEPQQSRRGENTTFCVQQVQATGDCLFHALNVAMDGPIEREHPRVLRRKICDYLGRPAGDPMRLDGTYGTQVEVGAVCGLRGFEVVVYNDLGDLVYRTAPTDRDRELHGRPGSVYLICVGVRADGLAVTAEGEHYQPVAHANHATPAEVRALVINFRGPLRGAPRSEQRF